MINYKYIDGAYHLHIGDEPVLSMPAMKDGQALEAGEEPSQIDPNERPVPTKHQRIAIAYFVRDKSIATHGDVGQLKSWLDSHNKIADADHKAALHVFKDSAPAEDINRALKDPAYFALLVS
jgi:hypothetical protein